MDARIWRNGASFAGSALIVVALTAFPSAARQQQQDSSQQSTGDPVADAARKAREQKKKETPKPKKVYTDDDLNHLVTGTAAPSGDANASGTTEEGAAKNSDAQGKDAAGKAGEHAESAEAAWRKRFREAYKNLDRAQRELDILQREDNKAQLQYYNDPQKALAEQYTRKDINDKDAKIAAKKKEIDQIKQQISDMEDALRKSGGDPGWAAP
jgi:glucose/arabinose dehydrogenase